MCGLVGIYSSNMLLKHKDCFKALLYLDTWRGRDATGVSAIRANADTHTMKSTVPGYEFIEPDQFDKHLKLNDFCWIGHNRYGTIGKNTRANAHPFEVLDKDGTCLLVGAHNGTLKNKYDLKNHADYGTDSEALFNQIADEGIEEVIPKIEGAWALSYYDHIAEELCFIRNDERPLFYAFEDDHKTLIWASEMWMIRVSAARYGIKLEEDKVWAFAEDTLYKFPVPLVINQRLTMDRKGGLAGKKALGFFRGSWAREKEWDGGRAGGNSTARTQQEAAEAARAARESKTSTSQNALVVASNMECGMKPPESGKKQTTNTKDSSKKVLSGTKGAAAGKKVVAISTARQYKGCNGVKLSKKEIEEQLANGCAWCEQEFIELTDRFAWLAPGKPICSKCIDGQVDNLEEPKEVTVH